MSDVGRSLVLVGPRGAGKTTLARAVAGHLAYEFRDTDDLLAQAVGCDAGVFLEREGESVFRAIEGPIVAEALGSNQGGVLAVGGGAVLSENVRNLLAHPAHFVVFLSAPTAVLVDRLRSGSFRPPLTNLPLDEEVGILARDREPLYRAVSDLDLDTNSLDVPGCQAAILGIMGLGGG